MDVYEASIEIALTNATHGGDLAHSMARLISSERYTL
jgi:hypothetical protein